MNISRKTKRTAIAATAIAAVGILVAGCDSSGPSAQQQAEQTTNTYQQAAQQHVPYPLAQMKAGGWTERGLLSEHLKRQNDPKALRYIVWLSQQGQVIAQWPIQGMVFDPNSQLTNSQTVNDCPNGGSTACGVVTDAPGDNGTWGPEAGAAAFFTTSGVEIQLPASAIWVESDSPLNITTQPLITYNVNSQPSVNYGGVKVGH